MALSVTPKAEIEFDAGVWTDVSSYTRDATWRRGRNYELDRIIAGTARATLDNRDRRFDPEHTTGPYYGKLLPRKRIRLGWDHGGTTYWRFYGLIDRWPQAYNYPNDAVVEVTATDAFKRLGQVRLPSPWEQAVRTDQPWLWWRLGEQQGTQAFDAAGNGRHGTHRAGVVFNGRQSLVHGDGDTALEYKFGNSEQTDLTAVVPTVPFTFELWFRVENDSSTGFIRYLMWADSPAGAVGIYMTAGGDLFFQSIDDDASSLLANTSGTDYRDGAIHHLVGVQTSATDARIYIDGALADSDTPGSPGSPAPLESTSTIRLGNELGVGNTPDDQGFDGIIDEFIVYDRALSAAEVLEHHTAGATPWEGDTSGERITRILDYVSWPVGDRDIDTGAAVLVAADLNTNALDHMQQVSESEGGRLFVNRDGQVQFVGRSEFWSESVYRTSQATFGDDLAGGELPYKVTNDILFELSDDFIINRAEWNQPNKAAVVVEDTTSSDPTTGYGLSTLTRTVLESRASYVKDQAEWIVQVYKDPRTRIGQVTIEPERDPANLYPVLGVSDLGYRYTFKRRPQNVGSAISLEHHLEGISESVSPGRLSVGWQLSPTFGGPFWIAGVAKAGVDTRPAY